MLQPFEQFKPVYIDRLLKLNKRYLVAQSYTRLSNQFAEEKKIHILLSDYEEYVLAKTHWDALKTDPYRAVLDLQKSEHKAKLIEMLDMASKYLVFWAIVKSVKELEALINTRFPEHLKRYIEKQTNWRVGRDKTLRPSVQLIFGELFIILKYSGQTLRVKFEEIEKA